MGKLSRRTEPVDTVVFRFGLREPDNWGDDCEEQARKQIDLWNDLVDIDEVNRAKVLDLTAEEPAIAEMQAQIEALTARIDDLVGQRKRCKQSGQQQGDLPQRIAAAKAERSRISSRAKEARRAARAARQPDMDRLKNERIAAVKAARQKAASAGLWWGHYNAVCDSYERARGPALKKNGRLRRKGYGSDVRFTNQIQDGGMSVAALFAGTHSQVQIAPPRPAGARGQGVNYTTLTATIYARGRAERRTVTWPLRLHRPIPDDVRIKEAVVTRRRIAHKTKWHVILTCTRPLAERSAPDGPVVAVDLGWRRLNDGLRVATYLRSEGSAPLWITLPEDTIKRADEIDALRSERDSAANRVLAWLRELPWGEAPEGLREQWTGMLRAPKIGPRALDRLCMAWRAQNGGCRGHRYDGCWRPRDLARLDAWRAVNKKEREEEQQLRVRLQGGRRKLFHLAARSIVAEAGAILFDKLDLRQAAQLPRDGSAPRLPDMARRYRQLACVHELRQWITLRAKQAGIPVLEHDGTSRKCWHCGVQRDETPRSAQLIITCGGCGRSYDQDVNDCRYMLRARREGSGGDPDAGSDSEQDAA